MTRLLVVGGGIAGLSAAWRARALDPGAEITVLEQGVRLGGKILTEKTVGLVLDAGADGFLSRKPAAVRLCRELGVDGQLQGQVPREKRSFVLQGHSLHPLPEGFSGLVPTNADALLRSTLLSDEGKQRALREKELPADQNVCEESIAQFMTRRFGREVFQVLMEPLLSGIYAGDADSLSLSATFPHLRQLELRHGSVTRGLAAEAPKAADGALPPFLSFADGMGELVRALCSKLADAGVRLMTGVRVTGISAAERGYTVTYSTRETEAGGFPCDALILAIPPAQAAVLLGGIDPELARLHSLIPSASTAIIHLAYTRSEVAHDLDGYGYVIPRIEGSDLLACTWSSSKWPGRSPPETALLRLYAGRFGGPNVLARSDAQLVALARKELAETMAIHAQPVMSRVFRWPSALPQYTLDHPRLMAGIKERMKAHDGLGLAGAAYAGVGIPDCVESGSRAAERAMEKMA